MVSDFDPSNIKASLDLIDKELNAIEDEKPGDEGNQIDIEINEIMQANSSLWQKVGEISSIVGKAIEKAKEI